jgi:hypothetical protein
MNSLFIAESPYPYLPQGSGFYWIQTFKELTGFLPSKILTIKIFDRRGTHLFPGFCGAGRGLIGTTFFKPLFEPNWPMEDLLSVWLACLFPVSSFWENNFIVQDHHKECSEQKSYPSADTRKPDYHHIYGL